jgi:ribonucleases P/MRP protein subunit RPP40
LKWIEAFLKDRRQRVVLGEVVSDWLEIFSGVPQGSVIGPLLFVIYINDLPKRISNTSKLYADDTKIMSKLDYVERATELQWDLDSALEWTKKWLLRFNASKCLVMHYGNGNPKCSYNIDGVQLVESNLERDLGVLPYL